MPASQYLFEAYVYIRSLTRERQILFWTIAFPIIYLVLIIYIFGGGSGVSFNVAVVDRDNTEASKALIGAMNSSGLFRIKLLGDSSNIDSIMRDGRYDAILIIPQGFGYNISNASQSMVSIIYTKGSTESESARAAVEGFIGSFGSLLVERLLNIARPYMPEDSFRYAVFIAKPINVTYSAVETNSLSIPGGIKMYYVLSTIGFMILYTGLFTGLGSIVGIRREGVIGVILSSPIESHKLFIANLLSGLVSIAITSMLIIVVGLALGANMSLVSMAGWGSIALLLFLGAIGVMGIGYIIAPFLRSSEAAAAIANAIAFPTMFLGGIAIPKFLLPQEIRVFADIYPLSRIVDSVRNIAVYGWDPRYALEYSLPSSVISIAVVIAGWILYRRALEHAAERP